MPRTPICSSRLPFSQCCILYSVVLANPITMLLIEQNLAYISCPVLTDLATLFCTFSTLHLTHQQISSQDLSPIYAMAMQTTIVEAHTLILDLLQSKGLSEVVDGLPEGVIESILEALSPTQHAHYLREDHID